MFYVGQRVVCVDDSLCQSNKELTYYGDLDGLTKGEIYTVRNTDIDPFDNLPIIRVFEIKRGNGLEYEQPFELGFLASRFRPIVERDTDISIFKKMLKPEKVDG